MERKDEYTESCGSLIYHAKQLRKGINVKDHIKRAKARILLIEKLANIEEPKKDNHTIIRPVAKELFDNLPCNQVFSGTKFAKRVLFLVGRPNAHKDSVLRVLRDLRQRGVINFESIDSKPKSLYRKIS